MRRSILVIYLENEQNRLSKEQNSFVRVWKWSL